MTYKTVLRITFSQLLQKIIASFLYSEPGLLFLLVSIASLKLLYIMSRPKKAFQNRDDNDTKTLDFTQLMGGIVSLLLFVLMCIIVGVLNARRRRRVSQELYEAAVAAEQEIIDRKHSLEKVIRVFVSLLSTML